MSVVVTVQVGVLPAGSYMFVETVGANPAEESVAEPARIVPLGSSILVPGLTTRLAI